MPVYPNLKSWDRIGKSASVLGQEVLFFADAILDFGGWGILGEDPETVLEDLNPGREVAGG